MRDLWNDIRDAIGATLVALGTHIMADSGRAMLARELRKSDGDALRQADVKMLHPRLREAISNAYYGARNQGRTMEQAADDAADGCEKAVKVWLYDYAATLESPPS